MDKIPHYAHNLNWLGHVHLKMGNMDEAEDCYRKALSIIQEYDPNDRSIIQTKHYIADVYLESNRPKQAEEMLQTVISDWETYPDPIKDDLLKAYSLLGELQLKQERHSEADANLNKAIALQTEISNSEFPYLVSAKRCLAGVYIKTERYAEAEPLLLEILPVLEKDTAAESKYPEVVNEMIDICLKQGRQTEAETWKAIAVELKAKLEIQTTEDTKG